MSELIIFTGGFPYGSGETFLETEVIYLAQGFDQVHFVAVNPSNSTPRNLPDNCTAEGLFISLGVLQKIASLRYLVSPLFWQEYTIIRQTYKQRISRGIVKTMLISLYNAEQVRKHAEKLITGKQQIFYSYWCDDAALGLAMMKEKFPQPTTVCRAHGWDVYFEVHPLNYLPFRQYIADQMSAVFTISQKGKETILNTWKVTTADKVIVSRLGVVQQQAPYNTENNIFTIVSCSNLIPLKRVELIISALAQVPEQPMRWIHFGEGSELARLKRMAKNSLGEHIHWEFKGRKTNREVLSWYAFNQPAVFINVSSSEGIPVSIMEAMSFGIPCIATDVGGSGEIVNYTNGVLLAEHPTPEEVAKALQLFLTKEVGLTKSEGALKTWEERYNAEKNYTEFVAQLN
jgi:glycosyltransferase involved in cell wall biosynthesis